MFIVKEYNKEDKSYIGHTSFLYEDHKAALVFAKQIAKRMENIRVIVTELDFNEFGAPWELIIWEGESK